MALIQVSVNASSKPRELGCDEDEAAFEEKLKQIATAKTVRKRDSKAKRTE